MTGARAGLGWIEVSGHFLRELLHAPHDTDIVGADFKYPDVVRLLLSSPALPIPEDESIPTVYPTIAHKAEEYVWDWNLT